MGAGPGDQPVRVRSANEAAQQGARAASRIADLLRLIALFALALGALGVAALAAGMMRLQAEDLAVLRVLGATRARAAGVFAAQAVALGAAGGLLGTLIGSGLAALAALAMGLQPVLPAVREALVGVALGATAALAAAALPALALARMQPLAVLRGDEPGRAPRGAVAIVLLLAVGLGVTAAALEVRSWIIGPAVAIGAAVAALLLALAGRVLLPFAARLRPRAFALRHGLANLARPGRRPIALMVALGLAAALGSALLVLHGSLAAQLAPGRAVAIPSFFVIDLQDDQREAFTTRLVERGLRPNLRPQVRARLRSIDNVEATRPAAGDTREAEHGNRMRRREQNLTWAAAPGPGETLIAGRWPAAAGECAVQDEWAKTVGARIGSRLVFDVQGVEVVATITGLRRIDWWTFQPNFFVSLAPGTLDGAPTVWLGTIPAQPREQRRALVADLAREFPNVSLIDVAEAAVAVRSAIDRAAVGVAAIAAVALLAGLAVAAGTAAATARERRAESALVRALGGRQGTVALALAVEFAAASAVAGLVGAGFGIAGGLALTAAVLSVPTVVPWAVLAALVAVLAAAATATALAVARSAWLVPPLAALREE
jgi:putative ABC transport system permease protein